MKLMYLTRVLISMGIAVAALNVIVMVLIFPRLEEGLKKFDTLEFAPLNFSQLTDGDYEGNFAAGIVDHHYPHHILWISSSRGF